MLISPLEAFLKIVGNIVALLQQRRGLSEKKLKYIVDPVMKDFEEMHKEYILAFEGYRARIVKAEESLDEISQSIDNDRLFKAAPRLRIISLLKSQQADPDLRRFIGSLGSYVQLRGTAVGAYDDRERVKRSQRFMVSFVGRIAAAQKLYPIDSTELRLDVISSLELTVGELQRHYVGVIESYAALRDKLV